MTLKPGKQTIAIHILPNISRSKGNQVAWWVNVLQEELKGAWFNPPLGAWPGLGT